MELPLVILDIQPYERLCAVHPEMYAKGFCYAAEDVLRRQVVIVAQRMTHVQQAIEDICGEPLSLSSLFESATLKLRKGRTGSFRVHRLTPEEVPHYLDERRGRFSRIVIAARTGNTRKWHLHRLDDVKKIYFKSLKPQPVRNTMPLV